MKQVRANFTDCCDYPALIIANEVVFDCASNGASVDVDYEGQSVWTDQYCDLFHCTFKNVEILVEQYADRGNGYELVGYDIDYNSIMKIFLSSVGYDEQWVPILNEVVPRCYDQFFGSDLGFECYAALDDLYNIITCSYKQNFLKCPSWNPQQIFECQYTYEYVSKCIEEVL